MPLDGWSLGSVLHLFCSLPQETLGVFLEFKDFSVNMVSLLSPFLRKLFLLRQGIQKTRYSEYKTLYSVYIYTHQNISVLHLDQWLLRTRICHLCFPGYSVMTFLQHQQMKAIQKVYMQLNPSLLWPIRNCIMYWSGIPSAPCLVVSLLLCHHNEPFAAEYAVPYMLIFLLICSSLYQNVLPLSHLANPLKAQLQYLPPESLLWIYPCLSLRFKSKKKQA